MSAGEQSSTNPASSYRALTYLSLFGLAVTIPLLLLLGALLIQSATTQRDQLEVSISQVLDALVNEIDRDIDRDITILKTLATSQALKGRDWPAFYDQAKAGLQGRAYLVLVDANGRQLVNTYVAYGEQPAVTGDPETVRRMAQTGAPVVSNLFVSLVVKRPVFNVSIPVFEGGEFRYVMSLGLLPEQILAVPASQRLGPDWVTMIWDANGVILARSRDHARWLGTAVPEHLRAGDQRAIVRATNIDGVDVLHATIRSQVSGWGVGVNIPYALISGQMRKSLLLWGVASVCAVAIALLLGLTVARQITTPLSVASRAAAAFGRGETLPIAGSRLVEANAFLTILEDARRDLTKAQSHQNLLSRELQHRTQNLFAVVRSIVSKSLREGQTVAQAKEVIGGRLQAVARTHSILAGAAWEGAPLQEILARELGEDFSSAVDAVGCDIVVNAGAAQQFALIIHELVTNALKYGALSVPEGRVSVVCDVKETDGSRLFSFRWRERDGPPVSPPARKGFGSVILFDATKQFGMDSSVAYLPEGLHYELRVPLRHIAPSTLAGQGS